MTASKDKPAPATPADPTITYQNRRGRTRRVLVGVDSNGVWVVYDVASHAKKRARRGLLVDRLLGDQEKAKEARALAVDYADCQTAFTAGRRDEFPNPNPLPRAMRVPLALIDRETRAAARRAVAKAQQLRAGDSPHPASDPPPSINANPAAPAQRSRREHTGETHDSNHNSAPAAEHSRRAGH